MKPEFTTTVESLSHDGRGIARIDGKITFIQGALANEVVTFQYLKRKRSYDDGIVVSVQTPSPYRVEPKCPHFSRCGGCTLQHMESSQQIQEKQTLFLDMLARIGHCKPELVLPPLIGPLWHYRHKARLSVRYNKASSVVRLGFRERINPRWITEMDVCSILHERVSLALVEIRELIASFDAPDSIAQVEVAAGDDEVALVFRNLNALTANDEEKLIQFAKATGFRIFLQSGGPATVTLFYPKDASEFLTYRLPEENISFLFHPTDFIQINVGLNRLMIPLALKLLALTPEDKVLDLFCGLGNFSLPIARHCKQVIGVEGSDTMVQRASMNASLNQLTNVEFFSANLDDESVFELLTQHSVNKLLIDPPRAGAFEVVKQIERIAPKRIVYVSCNPATLARDADVLVNEKGYRLTQAGVMDMFPHTDHVESIALFEKD